VSAGDDPTEGRVRRSRTILVGVLGLALLVALPFVFERFAPDRSTTRSSPPQSPAAAIPTPRLSPASGSGRLVYVGVDPNGSGVPRLVALDVASGTYQVGPVVRDADRFARLVAVGPERRWLVLIHRPPGEATYVANLIDDLSGAPHEVARGGEISVSADGGELLVADVVGTRDVADCARRSYQLVVRRVALASGRSTPAYLGRRTCHRALEWGPVALGADDIIVNDERGEAHLVYRIGAEGRERLFRGVSSRSASGTFLYAQRGMNLLVWPGGGGLRPIVTGERTLGTIVAASASGRYVVVHGSIHDEPGTWLVDVAAGVVDLGPGTLPSGRRFFAETVADDGTVYLVGYESIVAIEGRGTEPAQHLPPGAPNPVVGPVAWLP
jgi:hypothetical protein